MFSRGFIFIIACLLIVGSCSKKNRLDINISAVSIDIEVKRLDKELFELDPGNVEEKVPGLIEKYGEFFELYNARVINLGDPYDSAYSEHLTGFITDYTMNKVYGKVMEVYPNVDGIQTEIEQAFKRYKYYFPNKKIPALYTYIGGFNQSIVIADSILGIGIDKYLGKDCEFYDRLGYAKYLQKNMNPGNVPTDVLRAWALTEFEYNDSSDNLINNMIYHGKTYYFLDAVFPDTPDSLKIGFTSDQMRWCIKNENQMWNYLIDQKLIFSTDYMTINKHINPAPFTSGYPNESPGRASVWLGWQIVKKYMDRNSGLTIKELMLDDDYQNILSESRYDP